MRPRILILHATGTNRDREAARAFSAADGDPEIVHLHRLLAGELSMGDYQMLVLPGGFSYGDDLGAGKRWSVLLREQLGDDLAAFVASGRPVIGICNGFQALVKAGLLPGGDGVGDARGSDARETDSDRPRAGAGDSVAHAFTAQSATLTRNESGRFECRWVWLRPDPLSPCVFTRGLDVPLLHCPVAHGEGRFVAADQNALETIEDHHLAALRYVDAGGAPGGWPINPNGSDHHIAGICNRQGNVLGLMPHPEDHIADLQHPRYHRGERDGLCLALFAAGVRHAAAC